MGDAEALWIGRMLRQDWKGVCVISGLHSCGRGGGAAGPAQPAPRKTEAARKGDYLRKGVAQLDGAHDCSQAGHVGTQQGTQQRSAQRLRHRLYGDASRRLHSLKLLHRRPLVGQQRKTRQRAAAARRLQQLVHDLSAQEAAASIHELPHIQEAPDHLWRVHQELNAPAHGCRASAAATVPCKI